MLNGYAHRVEFVAMLMILSVFLPARAVACQVRVYFHSDPSGAHVYYEKSGDYYGVTSDSKAIYTRLECMSNDGCEFTFLFKKRGYKPTRHTIRISLADNCRAEADKRITVFLETEKKRKVNSFR